MRVIFIGGELDGERDEISGSCPIHRHCCKPEPSVTRCFKEDDMEILDGLSYQTYYLQQMVNNGREYYFMVIEGLPCENIFTALLNGYRQQQPERVCR